MGDMEVGATTQWAAVRKCFGPTRDPEHWGRKELSPASRSRRPAIRPGQPGGALVVCRGRRRRMYGGSVEMGGVGRPSIPSRVPTQDPAVVSPRIPLTTISDETAVRWLRTTTVWDTVALQREPARRSAVEPNILIAHDRIWSSYRKAPDPWSGPGAQGNAPLFGCRVVG